MLVMADVWTRAVERVEPPSRTSYPNDTRLGEFDDTPLSNDGFKMVEKPSFQ